MARRRDQDLLDAIGRRIQRLRLERQLTQRQLAEAIGVEPESISRAETGAISLSLSNLFAVARALRVPLSALVDADLPLPAPEPGSDHGELVRLYDALDGNSRRALLGAARGIADELCPGWRRGGQ